MDPHINKTQKEPNGTIMEVAGLHSSVQGKSSNLSIPWKSDVRKKPKIPDGGWGWVIVASAFVSSMICDGISYSFGLLYIELLDYFGTSKSATAWIGSLFVAVPLLTGPIMSAFVDRYGCRSMTIVGGLIATFGFLISFPANSIVVMYVTFGVIAGLGLGLCYVTAMVSIAYWFDKKRTLAIALGACGSGIGTFVYAPMSAFFINEFGWRGTIILLAGTLLNLCVCGAVMREPDWIMQQLANVSLRSKRSRNNSSSVSTSKRTVSESEFPGVKEIRKIMKSSENPDHILEILVPSSVPISAKSQNNDNYQSLMNLPTFVNQSEKVPLEVCQQISSNAGLYQIILDNYPNILATSNAPQKTLNGILEKTGDGYSNLEDIISKNGKSKDNEKEFTSSKSLNNHEMEKLLAPEKTVVTHQNPRIVKTNTSDVLKPTPPLNRHYLKNLKIRKHSFAYRGAMLNIPKYRLHASSCPNIYRNSLITLSNDLEDPWYITLKDFLQGMVDFSLFLDLHFLLMSVSTTLLFTWFIVPYFYLAEHLITHGYSENEASMVISVIGITTTIGMIGLGWAGDQPWLNVTKTYSICVILCGVSCLFFMFFTNNFTMLLITAGFFGIFFSSNYSYTPTILVELISLDNFTQAYGLSLLCQGMGHLLGPPLAGALFDLTGTWEQSFWQAGCWIIVAGVIVGFIPYTKNRKLWEKHVNKSVESEINGVI